MAAHDFVETSVDLLEEQSELYPLVAPDIGTWSASGAKFLHRGRDDAFLVLGLERNDVERDAGLLTNRAGVLEVLLPRTIPQVGQFVFEPDLQIKSGNVPVPGLFHQPQGHGTVHAARY